MRKRVSSAQASNGQHGTLCRFRLQSETLHGVRRAHDLYRAKRLQELLGRVMTPLRPRLPVWVAGRGVVMVGRSCESGEVGLTAGKNRMFARGRPLIDLNLEPVEEGLGAGKKRWFARRRPLIGLNLEPVEEEEDKKRWFARRRPLIGLNLEPVEEEEDPTSISTANSIINVEPEPQEEEGEEDDMASPTRKEYMVGWPGSPCSSSGSCSPEPQERKWRRLRHLERK